jgi:hypothetical protein
MGISLLIELMFDILHSGFLSFIQSPETLGATVLAAGTRQLVV